MELVVVILMGDARCVLELVDGAQSLLVVAGLTLGALLVVRVALSIAERRARDRTTQLLKELSPNGEGNE